MRNKQVEKENLRQMIDGELNRISITDDKEEIIKMLGYLIRNINKYADMSYDRINEQNIRQEELKLW